MQVTGEEGIALEDFVTYQKATLVDMVYLQQDAFDPVDVSAPPERQQETFSLIKRLVERDYQFDDKEQAQGYFTEQTGLLKNLNYSPSESQDYHRFLAEIEELEKKHLGDGF
jgi:V/A-type H+-transporting ATPase subunit A